MTFTMEYRVRYGDCDMQRVVWNPNYFGFCDDAVDVWVRQALADELKNTSDPASLHSIGFDFMLKKTTGTWEAPTRFGDTLVLACIVTRWGNTSFDVKVEALCNNQLRFIGEFVYVSVDPVAQTPALIPEIVKKALSS
jgi:acyl-CoA thioester hydrolase